MATPPTRRARRQAPRLAMSSNTPRSVNPLHSLEQTRFSQIWATAKEEALERERIIAQLAASRNLMQQRIEVLYQEVHELRLRNHYLATRLSQMSDSAESMGRP